MQNAPSFPTPYPDASPTCTAFQSGTLAGNDLNKVVNLARQNGGTFFSTAYAASAFATMSTNPLHYGDDLALYHWANMVNLRHKDLLTQDDRLLCAAGYYIITATDLGRFVRNGQPPSTEDLWTLGREVKQQMVDQQPEIETVAMWGDSIGFRGLPPSAMQAAAM